MLVRCTKCRHLFNTNDKDAKICIDCQEALAIEKGDLKPDNIRFKVCPWCSSIFYTTSPRKIYCSAKCRLAANRSKKKYDANKKDKPIPPRYCLYCNKLITTPGALKYCSKEHRMLYYQKAKLSNKAHQAKTEPNLPPDTVNCPKPKPAKPNSTTSRPKPATASNVVSDYDEMQRWRESKKQRAKWVKIPLEEADAICKKYHLTYPQYQAMRYDGTLQAYMEKYDTQHRGEH